MRPFLAAAIWIVLIGGLTLYMNVRDTAKPPAAFESRQASGTYSAELTTTFPLEVDPFALHDESEQAALLLMKLNGKVILKVTDQLDAGSSLTVDPLSGVQDGLNEFYVEASPPIEASRKSYAIRIQLREDHRSVLDRTLWSEPGSRISATIQFRTDTQKRGEEREHGH
jgi:hypothetical protein